jgi:hypothetical protein
MIKKGETKAMSISNGSQQSPKGIILNSKGIALTSVGLPMADHFFQATSYRIKQVGSNLHMVFGAQSAFAEDTDQEYRLAIEMVYPIEMAIKYIYQLNWKQSSLGSSESFGDILQKVVAKEIPNYIAPKKYRIPTGSNFRSFPSNFSVMYISTGQASIEFFEAPPGSLVDALFQKTGWRPNSDVRAILTVVMPPIELHNFLSETKQILEKVSPSYASDDEKETNHV